MFFHPVNEGAYCAMLRERCSCVPLAGRVADETCCDVSHKTALKSKHRLIGSSQSRGAEWMPHVRSRGSTGIFLHSLLDATAAYCLEGSEWQSADFSFQDVSLYTAPTGHTHCRSC